MKTPRIVNAVGHIDGELIRGTANPARKVEKITWSKRVVLAACVAVVLMAAVIAVPMHIQPGSSVDHSVVPSVSEPSNENKSTAIEQNTEKIDEAVFEITYVYKIDQGVYSTYIAGKVIAEDKIGTKLSEVSVTAGWKNSAGEWESDSERLRGEVYAINGISGDVAVALKFIDKGEALSTTHYYVIMNPDADLTAVKDYMIAPTTPNNPREEGAVEEGVIEESTVKASAEKLVIEPITPNNPSEEMAEEILE